VAVGESEIGFQPVQAIFLAMEQESLLMQTPLCHNLIAS
jgi:hypothetical protein